MMEKSTSCKPETTYCVSELVVLGLSKIAINIDLD